MTTLADHIERHLGGRHVAVVGVGNRLRGDDAAGSLVVERLQGEDDLAGADDPRLIDAEQTPENYLDRLLASAPDVVLFVDATDLGAAPGTLRLAGMSELAQRAQSTHAPSLRLTAEILAAHGIASLLLGIQPARTALGAGLTSAVAAAVDEAAAAIAPLLDREGRHA